ncbi:hypothetical protein DACRYDRAFT_17740 [Dacryopinax primogenitus]|uniref:Uncharacterized protein n=1 Tax=Dacryopinax primogenitus (strain DJM 731) TaxID=1858805 RepID=M5FSZ9_DACPD|nr:uncharacterized protein DACRYDRAFT_17740 [Dacryopinax primogenitus]EJT99098.1 hypothetical protein DACRYDRAFT_17740 [Dacryopinax primogenitus]
MVLSPLKTKASMMELSKVFTDLSADQRLKLMRGLEQLDYNDMAGEVEADLLPCAESRQEIIDSIVELNTMLKRYHQTMDAVIKCWNENSKTTSSNFDQVEGDKFFMGKEWCYDDQEDDQAKETWWEEICASSKLGRTHKKNHKGIFKLKHPAWMSITFWQVYKSFVITKEENDKSVQTNAPNPCVDLGNMCNLHMPKGMTPFKFMVDKAYLEDHSNFKCSNIMMTLPIYLGCPCYNPSNVACFHDGRRLGCIHIIEVLLVFPAAHLKSMTWLDCMHQSAFPDEARELGNLVIESSTARRGQCGSKMVNLLNITPSCIEPPKESDVLQLFKLLQLADTLSSATRLGSILLTLSHGSQGTLESKVPGLFKHYLA